MRLLWIVVATVFLAACDETIEVATDSGVLEGRVEEGVATFLGVPFAQPPVGPLRWQPPARLQPAADSVLVADEWAPPCPQVHFFKVVFLDDDEPVGEEDCLYLNVWAPKPEAGSSPRAVMVFIHGGANELGSSRGFGGVELYDGERLARAGDVIVVTVAYRVGVFGFFTHPAVNGGVPGNWAFRDQVFALEWVQRNIAAFGGDPGRVTVFGESAGGTGVMHLLASPKAKGLFHRAILQSSPIDTFPVEVQQKQSADFVKELGCEMPATDKAADCLRRASVPAIVAAQPNTAKVVREMKAGNYDNERPSDGASLVGPRYPTMAYSPTVDGQFVAGPPRQRIIEGLHNRVPVILGTNRRELDPILREAVTEGGKSLRDLLQQSLPDESATDAVAELYPLVEHGDESWAFGAMMSDFIFHCPTKQVATLLTAAQTEPVYTYVFDDLPIADPELRQTIGVFHGAELLYVFRTLGWLIEKLDPGAITLQDRIVQYWANFAKEGNPNHMSAPLWMPFDPKEDNYLWLGRETAMTKGWRTQPCRALLRLVPKFFGSAG